MLNGKKIVVVLPAYNAARTLEPTYKEIPFDIVDDVVLVDDNSRIIPWPFVKHGIKHIIKHEVNKGYGGNQKSCYKKALDLGADIVIMLHPDYQYTQSSYTPSPPSLPWTFTRWCWHRASGQGRTAGRYAAV